MSKGKSIDERHLKMLDLILMDDRILESLHVDGNMAKKIQVRSNGSIDIGKYKYGWINNLFNAYYTISFFEVVQRIAMVITGGKSNNCDKNGLVGFILEAIDKILKKDEKEKVIELLLHYCTLVSEDSPLKLTYDIVRDNPMPTNTSEANKRRRLVGNANAVIDFGYDRLPVTFHVECDLTIIQLVGFCIKLKITNSTYF